MRTLTLELYDSESEMTVKADITDTTIKQCLYGRPFDLLADIQDLGLRLNTKQSKEKE